MHDYTGHPFQVQLSRALAGRGHDVLHLYCGSFSTPHGRLSRQSADPPGFAVEAVNLRAMVNKRSLFRRHVQERRYGRLLCARVAQFAPDVVLSANTPLEAQAALLQWTRGGRSRFVYWVQDLYGVAVRRILRRRFPVVGDLAGRYFEALERRVIGRSDHVVLISDDFTVALGNATVQADRLTVIENWAPLDEMPLQPRDNAWAREQGLVGRRVLLYAGTLGMKHNPSLLLALAERFRRDPDVLVAVVSEGAGADWVAAEALVRGATNVRVLGFQPFERMPEVLASAEVLLVLLEPDAGAFSVPSKVLTNLCAGRPQLAAMPSENLGARIIGRAGAGFVVDPRHAPEFVEQAERLLNTPSLREQQGRAARAYAEQTFDIEAIANRFERVLI